MRVFVLIDVEEDCAVRNGVVAGNIFGIHTVTTDRMVAQQWEAMGDGLYKAVEFELNDLSDFDSIAADLGWSSDPTSETIESSGSLQSAN